MLRPYFVGLGFAAAGLCTPASAQDVGQISYMEQALASLEQEFHGVGVTRTGNYSINYLNDDHYRDHTFRLTERGYVSVGTDADTRWVRLATIENGQPPYRNDDTGDRSATIYFSQPGTYTVRVHIADCSEQYCYYAVMSGYR